MKEYMKNVKIINKLLPDFNINQNLSKKQKEEIKELHEARKNLIMEAERESINGKYNDIT